MTRQPGPDVTPLGRPIAAAAADLPDRPDRLSSTGPPPLLARLGQSLGVAALGSLFAFVVLFGQIGLPEIRFTVQIAVAGLIAAYLVALGRGGRGLPRTPIDGPVLAVLAALWCATAFGLNPRLALDWLIPLPALTILFYAAVGTLRRGWLETVYRPAIVTLAGLVALAGILDAIGAYWGAGPFALAGGWFNAAGELSPPPVLYRVHQPLHNPNWLAALLIWLLPFTLAARLTARATAERIVLGGLCLALLVCLFATGSRGGLLGGLVALGLVLSFRRARPTTRRTLALAAAGLAILVTLLLVYGRGLVLDPARELVFAQAWQAFLDHPLAGIGPRNFALFQARQASPEAGLFHNPHPHNVPLVILAETGLIGLAASLAVLIGLAWWHRPPPPPNSGGSRCARLAKLAKR